MKILKLGFLISFSVFSTFCVGQNCKYRKKAHKLTQKDFTEEKIVKVTQYITVFSKLRGLGRIGFVKSEKEYYAGFYLARDYASGIDLLEDNPIVFRFKNDSIITIYPKRAIPSIKYGGFSVGTLNFGYYRVSPEQLKLFAELPIVQIKIYFSREDNKVKGRNTGKDDLGIFINYNLLKEKYQTNSQELAHCILQ